MLKMILKDYRMTWKQGLANVYNSAGNFLPIYLMIYPLLGGTDYNGKEEIIYYAGIGAYVLAILLSRMFPNRLEKTLYFCPMEREEREEYVRTAYWLRVLVPVVFLGIAQLVIIILGWVPIWSTLVVMVNVFCHALAMNIYIVRKEKKTMEYLEGWSVGVQLLGVVSILAGVMLQTTLVTENVSGGIIACVVAVLFLFVWLALHVVKKYRRTVFEAAISYEKN